MLLREYRCVGFPEAGYISILKATHLLSKLCSLYDSLLALLAVDISGPTALHVDTDDIKSQNGTIISVVKKKRWQ